MTKRRPARPVAEPRKVLEFGPLKLARRIIGSASWIEIDSLTKAPLDQHLIERAATMMFPDALLVGSDLGPLVRFDVLAAVLYAAGLEKWAVHLPHVADLAAIERAPAGTMPVLAAPPAGVGPSAFQIRELHALTRAGHGLEAAAHAVALDLRIARRLVSRSIAVKHLSADAKAAYADTFGAASTDVSGPLGVWLAAQSLETQASLDPSLSTATANQVKPKAPRKRPAKRWLEDPANPALDFGS